MTNSVNMTVREFAAYYGVSLRMAYAITEQEDFYPLIKAGPKKKLINKPALERWINEQVQPKQEAKP